MRWFQGRFERWKLHVEQYSRASKLSSNLGRVNTQRYAKPECLPVPLSLRLFLGQTNFFQVL